MRSVFPFGHFAGAAPSWNPDVLEPGDVRVMHRNIPHFRLTLHRRVTVVELVLLDVTHHAPADAAAPAGHHVTDTKLWDPNEINAFVRRIGRVGTRAAHARDSADRQHRRARARAPMQQQVGQDFYSVIFTLYLTGMSNEEVIAWVDTDRVPIVTMPTRGERAVPGMIDGLHRIAAMIHVHTVNAPADIAMYLQRNVDGFCADFYRPGP